MCKEVTCKCKGICVKMQEAGLREVVNILKRCTDHTKKVFVIRQLNNMENILTVYKCLPASCLIERINWLKSLLKTGSSNEIYLKKYIIFEFTTEVETFLNTPKT